MLSSSEISGTASSVLCGAANRSMLVVGRLEAHYDVAASAVLPPADVETVETLLSAQYGVRVRVGNVEGFPYSRVSRCWLEAPGAVSPPTVIVRLLRDDPSRSGGWRIQNERAALEFLTSIGSPVAPRIIAGDAASRLLIAEDLGHHPSLLHLLLGADRSAACHGLRAFARGMGGLHADTIGYASAYEEHRMRFGLADPGTEYSASHPAITENWARVRHAVHQLGLPQPRGVAGDVEVIAHLLAGSSDGLALSSGDPSPLNCMVVNDEVRFFDFEDACFRHPLIDASVMRYLYPTGGPVWHLPPEVANSVEASYRDKLRRVCPFATDDEDYEQGIAAACAAWTILRMTRLTRVDAGPDRDSWPILPLDWSAPIPTRSRRQQLVSILETCISSLRQAGVHDALAAWFEAIATSLRARWPEAMDETLLYPAFQ